MELVLDARPTAVAMHALASAEAELHRLERLLSRFDPGSELSRLNERGTMVVGRELLELVELALAARERTGGSFDPTVHDALVAAGYDRTFAQLPGRSSAPPLAPARCAGDVRVHRESCTIELERGIRIDLGGIAKGYAADRASTILAEVGPCLIDAGGDIATFGRPDATSSASSWTIALEDPSGDPDPIATCELPEGWAIATSSTRIGRRIDASGRVAHHLLDPRTGEPGGGSLVAVTVACPDPAWAEVWTKELFLEGPRGIGALARARGRAAWWVDAEAGLSMTPSARLLTPWVRSESGVSPRAASAAFPPASPSPARG
jgi:thiamine biosynthesis lipoprotein